MTPVAELPETGGTFSWEGASEIVVPAAAVIAIIGLTYLGIKAVVTGGNPLKSKKL